LNFHLRPVGVCDNANDDALIRPVVADAGTGLKHRLRRADIQTMERPVVLDVLHRESDLDVLQHQALHSLSEEPIGRRLLRPAFVSEMQTLAVVIV